MVHLAVFRSVGDDRYGKPEMHPHGAPGRFWLSLGLLVVIEMSSQRCTRLVHLADARSVGDDRYGKPEMHPLGAPGRC